MIRCYLALGSNLRSPKRQLGQAIAKLRALPKTQVIKVANFYSNKAWGRKSQPDFYNTVVQVHTSLTPTMLLAKCKKIEHSQGRLRLLKWSARTLDIDIVLYGDQIIQQSNLNIPHPLFLQRDFVVLPLLEIAPFVQTPEGQLVANLFSRFP